MSAISKCLAFLVVLCTISASGFGAEPYKISPDSPAAKRQHPRLFFTESSFSEIADYISSYEPADFETYIQAVDTAFYDDPAGKKHNYLLLDAQNFSFMSYAAASGFFGNFTFKFSAEEYAQKAFEHAAIIAERVAASEKYRETTHCNIFESEGQGGYINIALSIVYDWCYDKLSLPQRRTIADALITLYNRRDKEVNPGKKVKIGKTLLVHCHHAGAGGIVLWGDPLGDSYKAITDEMFEMSLAVWVDRIFAHGDHVMENAGGWSEGASYFFGGTSHVYFMAAALSSALGENMFTRFDWFRDIPRYIYFYLLPGKISDGEKRKIYAQRNDTVALREWDADAVKQVTPVIAAVKKAQPELAGFYRWFIEDSERKPEPAGYYETMPPRLYWLFFKFLWGYSDVKSVTAEQFKLPLSGRFGLGDVILLSDLHSENATKINFYTSQYSLPRHADEDHGAFTIFKYGTLALDGGVAKGKSDLPKSNKTRAAVYHSKVALYNPEESQLYDYSTKVNDDADAPWDAANQTGGANHIGVLRNAHFEPGKFDFVDFDATRAYKGENYVEKMRRVLLYFRDPAAPDYQNNEFVVIFDDIALSDSTIKRRWLLQMPTRPELLDGEWQKKGTAFWLANSGSTVSVTNNLIDAHGRLFVKFLEPQHLQLRLRGGSEGGEHYWFTDAEGNLLAKRGPYTDWGAYWAGSHRLEAEDVTDSSFSKYLTVMQIGDSRTLQKMADISKLSDGVFTGAFINQNRVAMFNTADVPQLSLSYSAKSSKKMLHVIEGLAAGSYRVSLNGKSIREQSIQSMEPLFFESSGGGNFRIEQQ